MNQTHSDTRQRILEQAFALFSRLGIRNVSMDDIARELGISKKTIYQYFQDKAELVYAVSLAKHEEEKCCFTDIKHQAQDAIEEVFKVMDFLTQTLNSVTPILIYEIQKYYPEAWRVHLDFDQEFTLKTITDNLQRGINEGYYRPDLNIEVMARLRMATVDMLFGSRWFPQDKFDLRTIHMEAFKYFLYGLLTDKGRERLRAITKN